MIPAELLGVLIKTAEIDPNDMKWQIWKDLGQEMLNKKEVMKIKNLKSLVDVYHINL